MEVDAITDMEREDDLEPLINEVESTRNDITNTQAGSRNEYEQTKPVDKLPWQLRYGVIEAVMLLYCLAMVTSIPIMEQYLYARILSTYERHNNNSINYCAMTTYGNNSNSSAVIDNATSSETVAQQRSATWQLVLTLCITIPAIFTTIVMGSYSDAKGRKLLVALPVFGGIIRISVTIIVDIFKLPIPVLIPGFLFEGICGGFGVFKLGTYAMLADITTNAKDRARRLVIVEAILGCGLAISFISTGYFIKVAGFLTPLVFVVSLHMLNFLVVTLLLPETVIPMPGAKILTLKNVKKTIRVYTKSEPQFRKQNLLLCLALILLVEPALHGKSSVETLYLLRSPLCWDSVKIGIFSGVGIFVQISCIIIAIKPLQKFLSNLTIALIGVISGLASLAMESVAIVDVVMFLVPVVAMFVMLTMPLLRSHMSISVNKDEQGALFSGISLVEMLSASLNVSILNAVYMATVTTFPGFVFALCAFMSTLALLLLLFLIHRNRRSDRRTMSINVDAPTTSVET